MTEHRVQTGILTPQGEYTNTGTINPRACPHAILAREHYDASGEKCRCDDPTATIMVEWGYVWNGKQWVSGGEEGSVD